MTLLTKKRGFTLIELIIVIAITVMIGIVLVELLRGYYAVLQTQEVTIDVNTSAAATLSEIHNAVLQADTITGSHTFSGTMYTTGSSTLVLELPSIDSSGNIISGSHDYIGFYATGTQAYKITDIANGSARHQDSRFLTDALSLLSFSYNVTPATGATSTTVTIVTQTVTPRATLSKHLREQTFLHNSSL